MSHFPPHPNQNSGYYYKPPSYQLINQMRDSQEQQLVLNEVGQCQLESEVGCEAVVYHNNRNVYQRERLAPNTSIQTSDSLYLQLQQTDDPSVSHSINQSITYADQTYSLPSLNMNYIQQVNPMQTYSNQYAQPSEDRHLYEQTSNYSPTSQIKEQQHQQHQLNFRQEQLETLASNNFDSSINQYEPVVTSSDRYNFSFPLQAPSSVYYQSQSDVYPSVKHRQQLHLQQQQQQQLQQQQPQQHMLIQLRQRQAPMEQQNSMSPLISDLQPQQPCDNVPHQCVEMITAQTQLANVSNLIPSTGSTMIPNNQIPRAKSDLDSSILFEHEHKQTLPTANSSQEGIIDNVALGQQEPQQQQQQQQQEEHHERQQQQDFVELKSLYGSVSQDWLDTICRHVIEHMNRYGICVIDNFLGPVKGDLILREVHQLYAGGQYTKGRLVSNKLSSRASNKETEAIRNDRVIWIDGCEEGCSEINNLIQTLCSVIMNSSRLSLYSNNGLDKVVINKRTRAHVACYPGDGTRYIKHVDNPNDDGRVITSIYYLNKDWISKRDGGLLRMFPVDIDEVANIEPLFDRVLFFWSDRRNPHEVLPSYRDRFAITVWYIGENRSS